jgi:hypothetical protein
MCSACFFEACLYYFCGGGSPAELHVAQLVAVVVCDQLGGLAGPLRLAGPLWVAGLEARQRRLELARLQRLARRRRLAGESPS